MPAYLLAAAFIGILLAGLGVVARCAAMSCKAELEGEA